VGTGVAEKSEPHCDPRSNFKNMALSVFDDKSKPPSDTEIGAALGGSFTHWNNLKKSLAVEFCPLSFEWGFTSKTTGWGMRVKHKERVILYMTPCRGHFLASLALGEKAIKAALASELPDKILKIIATSKKYSEGTGVRLEVRTSSDVQSVAKLATLKKL